MKILLTGSEGNLGYYIVHDLKLLGHEVFRVQLSRDQRIEENIAYGDLSNRNFIENIFSRHHFDAIIHCAARLYGVTGFNSDVYGLFQNDLLMLLNLLNNIQINPVRRFVYISSSMVYEMSNESVFKEDSFSEILAPESSYGMTKHIGEKSINYFKEQYPNFDFTIWRPFNIVSPRETYRPHAHVFVDFTQKILVEKLNSITFIGDGKQKRCFTWVGDVSSCISENIFQDFTLNQIFNIGQTVPLEMKELALIIAEYGVEKGIIDEIPKFVEGEKPKYDINYRVPSVNKINNFISTNNFLKPKDSIYKYLDETLIQNENGKISWVK